MELYRDLTFKRNLYGYVEESRVQLYKAYIRQVPMWIVYHPHNEEYDLAMVAEYGVYFLTGDEVVEYFNAFKRAWVTNDTYPTSAILGPAVIEAMRAARPDPFGLMYRVVYRCPEADIAECAIGNAPFDADQPWFVSTSTNGVGRWCIYPEHLAIAVMQMYSVTPFSGYVYDRIRDNPDGGMFIVQSTPYDSSGSPVEGEVWTDVVDAPHWNRRVRFDFNADMSKTLTIYDGNL